MFFAKALSLAAVLCASAASAADYFAEPAAEVVVLDTEAFESDVLKSEDLWLVEFYAPWCGHCQKLAPEWRDAAKRLKGEKGVKLGAMDCTGDDKETCDTYKVKGFPTIKVFGKDKEKPEDYKGGRDADAIEAFVKKEAINEPAGVSKLVPAIGYTEMHEFLTEGTKPKVLLFPDDKGVPSWFKMTASSFKASVEEEVTSYKQGKKVAKNVKKTVQKIMFAAAADDDTKKIAAKFSVEEAPALFLVFAGHITTYDGEFKKDELKEFLEEYADMEPPSAEELPEEDWSKVPRFPEKPTPKVQVKRKSVSQLNSDKLYNTCLKGTSCVLMLTNTATGEKDTYGESELMGDVAGKYRHDKFNFGWVNAAEQSAFAAQLKVESFPALVCIKGKRDKRMRAASLVLPQVEITPIANWIDNILGGGVQFKKLEELEMTEDWQLKMDAGEDDGGSDDL